ncbi:MAG: portal protein [Candidatus Acidiferrales bacterium]
MTDEDLISQITRRLGVMIGARALFDTYWLQIGQLLLPRQQIFLRAGIIPEGEKRTEQIFDSTGVLALQRFAAALESMLTPVTQMWHDIVPIDPALADNFAVKQCCQAVRDVLFACRYSPRANFAGQTGEGYMSVGAFGTAGIYIDEEAGKSLRYKSCNLSELYLQQNHQGKVDTVYRKFMLTARQAKQKLEEGSFDGIAENVLQDAANGANADKETEYLHCTQPNGELDPSRADSKGMQYSSVYIDLQNKKIVYRGGYRTFPWMIQRHVMAPREVYGRSPAMDAMPELRTLKEMRKDYLRQAQRALDPPLLLADEADIEAFDLRPGAQNYGAIGANGKPRVMGFQSGAEFPVGDKVIDDSRKIVNSHFYVDLFQILVENPGEMTATEVLERAQEKGALLAPTMGRQQEEYGTLIAREIDLLERAGQFAHIDIPPELKARGGLLALKVEYTSPLNRAMKSGEAAGFLRTMEALAPLANTDPTIFDVFDAEAVARGMADLNNVPETWLISPEKLAALKAQKAQAANLQTLVQATPPLAGAVKDLASAGATAGNVPAPQPGAGV